MTIRVLLALASILAAAPAAAFDPVDPEWLARYDGPDHGFDRGHALAVTTDGIYVTGESDSETTANDLFVVRYDLDGEVVWSARYDGPGSGDDRGLAIAVTADGSVLVAGQSWGGPTEFDLVTIKYGPDGQQQWVRRYNGPIDRWERAVALGLTPDGGVVVTGFSYYEVDADLGEFTEYVTIKYDTAGAEQWLARFTGPGPTHRDTPSDLAVDAEGDVYVTGSVFADGAAWDYGTVKYRGSDGAQLWERRHDQGSGSIDEAHAVAVGPDGTVYVTGSVSTDPYDGTQLDAVTIAYDPDGTQRWLDRYEGPGGEIDQGRDLAVDAAGTVYVAGDGSGRDTNPEYLLIKYDAAGTPQWSRLYDGPRGTDDYAHAVAIDPAGNAIVAGQSRHNSTYTDIVTLKYDPAGSEVWRAVHDGPIDTNDLFGGLAVGPDGAAHVVGTSRYSDEGVSWDAVTLRYPGGELTGAATPPPTTSRRLAPPVPNPSGALTEVRLRLEQTGPVRLEIHDLRGRLVRVMADRVLSAGEHRFAWDGRDGAGTPVAAGTYLCRLHHDGEVEMRRIQRVR